MDSDWILILKMKQGDDDAWEQFLRKYYGDILKYCFFHCRDAAEDLTQETFLRFFASLPRYQHMGKAKNYLYTIAANLCRDQAAAQRELPLDEVSPDCPAPADPADDRLVLEQAIRRLPEALQAVVVLHYYQGLKLAEVAAILKIGVPLVKYRLRQAKEQLRKETADGH